MNLNHLLAMGGYGLFVWPAYCITLFVFGMNLVTALQENRRVKKSIQQSLASSQ